MLKVVAEQSFLGGVLASVVSSQVDEAVGGEAVGHNHLVEVVIQAFALGGLRDVREHLLDLLRSHALALAEVVQLRAVIMPRNGGIQLVALPFDVHGVAVGELCQGGLETALADVAPRARDV